MQEDEKLLTMKETMDYLNVSRNTVYRFMRCSQLPGHKVGIRWRFYLEDLRTFVNRDKQVEEESAELNSVEQR